MRDLALILFFSAACSQPAPPSHQDAPSEEVATKKPGCDIDFEDISPPEDGNTASTVNEEERKDVFRAAYELRERSRHEAQKGFPTPDARGIAGPGQIEKELAVQSARAQQAKSLEQHYLGQLALDRQLSCDELSRIVREGLSKEWSRQ